MKETIKIRCKEKNSIMLWTMSDILNEINRDRSEGWTNYNKKDWVEGWVNWVESDNFYSIYNDKKETS